jgi:acid phosphatase family membrane protein YuiD
MDIFKDLFFNFPIRSALLTVALTQAFKVIFYYYRDRKINFKHLVSAGGMPSSHAAMVMSLSTSIAYEYGLSSPIFALTLIFSLIIMYDAAGVRRAVERQARVLNRILSDLVETGKVAPHRLQEFLGHTPFEVLIGAILGIVITIILKRML